MSKYINPYKMFIGAFIPDWLHERTEITSAAKSVYARLAQYAGKDGQAYPFLKTLSKNTGISISSVQRAIKELTKYKLIEVSKNKNNGKNMYSFLECEWMKKSLLDTQPDSNSKQVKMTGQSLTTGQYDLCTSVNMTIRPPSILYSLRESFEERVSLSFFDLDFEEIWGQILSIIRNLEMSSELFEKADLDLQIYFVIAYFNLIAEMNFNPRLKHNRDWIRYQLSKGEDWSTITRVICAKCKQWRNNAEMRPMLRPSTLFKPKNFDNYKAQLEGD